MSNYDNYDDDDRFRNLTAAYKPRPWGEDISMKSPSRPKSEPTVRTKISMKKRISALMVDPIVL